MTLFKDPNDYNYVMYGAIAILAVIGSLFCYYLLFFLMECCSCSCERAGIYACYKKALKRSYKVFPWSLGTAF